MLHHVDSTARQDEVLAEACRVLRPGGTFAGTDSVGGSLRFRLLHIGDVCTTIDPAGLPERLRAAGFVDVAVETAASSLRFRAQKPA
jgi:hypothetical protein